MSTAGQEREEPGRAGQGCAAQRRRHRAGHPPCASSPVSTQHPCSTLISHCSHYTRFPCCSHCSPTTPKTHFARRTHCPHCTQSTHKPTLPVAPAAPTHPEPSAPVGCREHRSHSPFGVSVPPPGHAAATIPKWSWLLSPSWLRGRGSLGWTPCHCPHRWAGAAAGCAAVGTVAGAAWGTPDRALRGPGLPALPAEEPRVHPQDPWGRGRAAARGGESHTLRRGDGSHWEVTDKVTTSLSLSASQGQQPAVSPALPKAQPRGVGAPTGDTW